MANEYLEVSCAIIESEDKVLIAQRSEAMAHPLKWEFPGGKWEAGESAERALQREILEELGLQMMVKKALAPSCYVYENGLEVRLWPFVCSIAGGQLRLTEHARVIWLNRHELPRLDWMEADLPILRQYFALPQNMTGSSNRR